ncbi:hypothetical protein [Devosia ginsengisoli]|uniref:hypothetical protein n=1 Tax=Devosia ginsengisoli TaxID=400770 RepID=UPI0026F19A61|nr:hypothetical protein [Devosia ginsengisoli]MCR6673263.1 hypothetical protein [Devosia ginsengisoli]
MVAIDRNDKVTIYSAAINVALAEAGKQAGDPDIHAALTALAHSTAYLIAKIKDRNVRRLAEKHLADEIGRLVAAEVNERILREQAVAGASS